MTRPALRRLLSQVLLGLIVLWATSGATGAQTGYSPLTQDQSSAPPGDAAAGVAVAQVGAGTTSGSTTGYSGPSPVAAPGQAKEIKLPPLPSAELCKDYQDTPAHESCLSVTLRE